MRIRSLLVVLIATVAACGGSTEPRGPSGIHVVSGADVTDTVTAALSAPLLIEVHDALGGNLPDGTVVRFTVVPDPQSFASGLICAFTSQSFSNFVASEPDASGKTGVLVRFGMRAGTFTVLIEIPALGLRDSVHYTVSPGAPARIVATPIDTAVYVGHSYTLRGAVTDQWGNARTDRVTWATTDQGISVSSDGVVTGNVIGRDTVNASAGGKVGIAMALVSVLPQADVVGIDGSAHIVTVGLDGSNRHVLTSVQDGGIGVHPRWIPGTNKVIYTTISGSLQTLFTVDQSGVPQQFFATVPPGITHQAEPTPSADGQWLYFIAYDTACQFGDYCLHRSKMDGSGTELLGNIVTTTARTWQPAPSPDGSQAALVVGTNVMLLNAQTQTVAPDVSSGAYPAWSPVGDLIAMSGGSSNALRVMNADGTGVRVLSTNGRTYMGYMTWTSDGAWILAQSAQTGNYELVSASTGAALAIPSLGLASLALR